MNAHEGCYYTRERQTLYLEEYGLTFKLWQRSYF